MIDDLEKALVEKYRGDPGYADGYCHGIAGEGEESIAPAYSVGFRAGSRAAKAFMDKGLARLPGGGFGIKLAT